MVSAPLAATSVNPTSYFVNSSNLFSIPTGTGVISETVGIGDATVVNTPLTAVIDSAARSLTLSSKKYKGGGLVGYVPEGGTTSTYLKGDGSWAAIPTGLIFKGTWAASTTAVVNGALAASVDLVIATADAEIVVGTVVEGTGITGTVRVDTVVSTTEFTLDTAITIDDAITLTMSPPGGLSPNIIGLTPADGWLYIVSVAGKAEPNSANPWTTGTVPNSWNIGDWCVYNGTAWTLVPSSTAGVTSVTTTDGTYIDLTPEAQPTGAVTVTADLSAQDGSSDTSTKFLSKDNTWDVPSYTTDTNTQNIYTNSWQQSTNDIILRKVLSGAGSGTQDIKIVKGANITFTYTDADNFTIAATDTNTTYTAGNGLNLSGTVFSADVNNTQANSATTALSATAGRFYAVQLDNNATIANADLVVNVPWTDTNTQNTYTAGAGLDLSSFEFSAKIDTTAADDDTVALSATANRFYAVQLDNNSTAADRKMVVNIPWTSGGSYNWILDADSSGTTRTVASGDTVDFTGEDGYFCDSFNNWNYN